MNTVDPNARAQKTGFSQQHQEELLKGTGIGGAIGMLIGKPILGLIAGAAYKLFSTEGMADGAKKIIGDFAQNLDVDGIKEQLGNSLNGNVQGDAKPDETRARQTANKSGIGWGKMALLGVGACLATNIFETMTMAANPLAMGLDPMAAMTMGGGLPFGGFGMPLFAGGGMLPLALLAGGGYLVSKMMRSQ